MLHEVVLPLAQRDDSALFKDKLAEDEDMQAALTEYKERLKVWFNKETQSMHLCGDTRKIKYEQWQEVLKKGKVIGIWEVHQESDIVGDERNRILHKCSLSLPQARALHSHTAAHHTRSSHPLPLAAAGEVRLPQLAVGRPDRRRRRLRQLRLDDPRLG